MEQKWLLKILIHYLHPHDAFNLMATKKLLYRALDNESFFWYGHWINEVHSINCKKCQGCTIHSKMFRHGDLRILYLHCYSLAPKDSYLNDPDLDMWLEEWSTLAKELFSSDTKASLLVEMKAGWLRQKFIRKHSVPLNCSDVSHFTHVTVLDHSVCTCNPAFEKGIMSLRSILRKTVSCTFLGINYRTLYFRCQRALTPSLKRWIQTQDQGKIDNRIRYYKESLRDLLDLALLIKGK